MTGLIISVIAMTSGILVFQKMNELKSDIYTNARSFAELTADDIVDLEQKYLSSNSFLFFNRDLSETLKKNADTKGVKIYDFTGKILYDYETEKQSQYQGPERQADLGDLTRIKSPNLSLLTPNGQTIYLAKKAAGEYEYVDKNGKPITKPANIKVKNIIQTINNEYAVQYDLSYKNLAKRLMNSAVGIAIISLFGVVISIFFGLLIAGKVTKPLKELTIAVKEIAKGDFAKRVEVHTEDEVGVLAQSVNQMAKDLESATEAKIYKERVKKELEIAAKIQQELLPKELPVIPDLDVTGAIWPATEIGGDVYDFLTDSQGNNYFYVGDVTGHGVPAGMISAVANATIVSTIETGDIVGVVANVNKVLRSKTAKNLFLTLLLLKHTPQGQLSFVNAGHEQMLHYRAATQDVVLEKSGGIALGLFDGIADKLTQDQVQMLPGDVLVVYTDGIPEAWANEKEQLGMEEFQEIFLQIASTGASSQQIQDHLYSVVKQYMGDYEQQDDITLVVLRKLSNA